MIQFHEDNITPEEYIHLREVSGLHIFSYEQAKKALDNTLKVITAVKNNKIIGMGRVVGDGVVICYIQDIIVLPEFRNQKIGKEIVSKLLGFIRDITIPETKMMIGLMSVKGSENFYESCGFIKRPNERFGNGFSRYIIKNKDGSINEG